MIENGDKIKIEDFVTVSKRYLETLGIAALRAYGRNVGVSRATAKKKNEIIADIIAIFCGELAPIERSKRGAPIRDDTFDPKIAETMNAFRFAHLLHVESALPLDTQKEGLDWGIALKEGKKRPFVLEVNDTQEGMQGEKRKLHVGQLETLNKVSLLLPLDCVDSQEKVVISVEYIHEFNLREGDVISCYAQQSRGVYVANKIVKINGIDAEAFSRSRFDMMDVCYPFERLQVYEPNSFSKIEHKFTQWLTPLGKGQRGLIISSPKAGKTQYLYSLAQAVKGLNPTVETYVLLVDQAPETVSAFRKLVGDDNLLYTTYDDDPDRQIFVADFLMKRAKCQVESGKDVVVFVDSFNALARAYNDTDESAGGKTFANGLESKTIHYIKKYLGAARQTEKKGSLTILGSVTVGTGNPADEMIATELSTVANLEIRLSDALAYKRVFPALDVALVHCKQEENLRTKEEMLLNQELRKNYLSAHSAEELLSVLEHAQTIDDVLAKI